MVVACPIMRVCVCVFECDAEKINELHRGQGTEAVLLHIHHVCVGAFVCGHRRLI